MVIVTVLPMVPPQVPVAEQQRRYKPVEPDAARPEGFSEQTLNPGSLGTSGTLCWGQWRRLWARNIHSIFDFLFWQGLAFFREHFGVILTFFTSLRVFLCLFNQFPFLLVKAVFSGGENWLPVIDLHTGVTEVCQVPLVVLAVSPLPKAEEVTGTLRSPLTVCQ